MNELEKILNDNYLFARQNILCVNDCYNLNKLDICKNNINNTKDGIYFWNIDEIKKKLYSENDMPKSCDLINLGDDYIIFIENTSTKKHKIQDKKKGTLEILEKINKNFIKNCEKEFLIRIKPKKSIKSNNSLEELSYMLENPNPLDEVIEDYYNKGGNIYIVCCDKFNLIFDKILKLKYTKRLSMF